MPLRKFDSATRTGITGIRNCGMIGGPRWLLLVTLISMASCFQISSAAAADEAASTDASNSFDLVEYSRALQPWKGDYDAMVERRMIRIAVPYSMTHYFLDGVSERGIAAAMGRRLEQEINRREGLRTRLVHVVFIPTPRKQLLRYLNDGLADIAMGSIAVSSDRLAQVSFTIPFIRNSEELLVTGPSAPTINALTDLAGQTLYLQPGSSYQAAVEKLSEKLQQQGLAAIEVEPVDELLEPDEILELIQAGEIGMTVTDRHLAEFWAQIFENLTVREDMVIASERNIAWAMRNDSPQLEAVLNEFLRTHRPRTEFGNIILRRYLQTVRWVNNTRTSQDQARYNEAIPYFRKYGAEYGLDPLLLAALGYQESRLNQSIRSPAGAIGVMQLLPRTGASMDVGDITELEPNIHAGTRYLNHLMERQVTGGDIDRLNTLFMALASYNAGQTRIRRLRREAARQGMDPDVWHNNVELLAAREIGRETVQYVDNIYKYFLSFQRVERQRQAREQRANQQ